MRHLVVGRGEVGSGLLDVLMDNKENEVFFFDLDDSSWDKQKVDVVHICIPYSSGFISLVSEYKRSTDLIIVHSTVPVGTCDELKVVHSPIRGVHPHMAEGIRTFVKYFGGKDAKKAAKIFEDLDIKTKTTEHARTTEALKLWDTTQYGKLIMMEKEIHKYCENNDVDFDFVYTQANQDYNDGYVKLGRPEVVRPFLKHVDGAIGGHCVVPNAELLKVKL